MKCEISRETIGLSDEESTTSFLITQGQDFINLEDYRFIAEAQTPKAHFVNMSSTIINCAVNTKQKKTYAGQINDFLVILQPAFSSQPDVFKAPKATPIIYSVKNSRSIGEIKKAYNLTKPEEIVSFISSNDYLLEILAIAPTEIKNIFGENTELHLELHHDPDEGFEELFIIIRTDQTPQKALALLNKLDNKWFLKNLNSAKGKLNLSINLV